MSGAKAANIHRQSILRRPYPFVLLVALTTGGARGELSSLRPGDAAQSTTLAASVGSPGRISTDADRVRRSPSRVSRRGDRALRAVAADRPDQARSRQQLHDLPGARRPAGRGGVRPWGPGNPSQAVDAAAAPVGARGAEPRTGA